MRLLAGKLSGFKTLGPSSTSMTMGHFGCGGILLLKMQGNMFIKKKLYDSREKNSLESGSAGFFSDEPLNVHGGKSVFP